MQPQAPPEDLLVGLSAQVPIALLPVKLETRFATRTESDGAPGIATLRVRIFPDELSITKGVPAYSGAELTAAADFWQAQRVHAAATVEDAAARESAWELYVQHVGAAKAIRLAQQTRDGAVPAGDTLGGDVPGAVLLPEAWVLVGEDDDGQLAFVHHLSRAAGTLRVGPSGRAEDAINPADALLLPEGDPARWVTDFDAAVACGMAAEIDLETPEQAASGNHPPTVLKGLGALYAFGVDEGDPAATADKVAELLADHAADSPLGFVKQRSATNNLGAAGSAWSAGRDEFAGFRFLTESPAAPAVMDPAVDALAGGAPDGVILEAALGLPEGAAAAFEGTAGRESWLSRNFSQAFFPVTLGQVLGDLARRTADEATADDTGARRRQETLLFARNHAISFVRSNGPVQPLRIGANPYGILPIMATDGWQPVAGEDSSQRRLLDILDTLRWYFEHAVESVPTLAGGTGDPAVTLLSILGRSALPHEGGWWLRDLVGPLMSMAVPPISYEEIPKPLDLIDTRNPLKFQMAVLETTLRVESSAVGALGQDAVRRLVSASFGGYFDGSLLVGLSKQGQKPVLRAVAQTATRSGKEVTPADYLDALLSRSTFPRRLSAVRDPNPPDDVLYVVAERALEAAGELDAGSLLSIVNPVRFNAAMALPPEVDRSSAPAAVAVTKDYTAKLADVSSDAGLLSEAAAGMSIRDVVWDESITTKGSVLVTDGLLQLWKEVNTLAGTRSALRVLAGARLSDADYSRLTSETLAASSHRLDAWYTSLATSRLATLRKVEPRGLHAGSWGVLVNVRPQSTAAGTQNPLARVASSMPNRWKDHLTAHRAAVPAELRIPQDPLGYVHTPSLSQAVTAGILRSAEAWHAGGGSSLAGIDLTSKRVRTALDIVAAMQHGQPLAALLGQQLERKLHADGAHTAVAILRGEFPQRRTTGLAGEPAAGDDAVVPAEVLNGLDVWEARAVIAGRADLGAVGPALQDLDDTVESVADLLVADGVHQLASGRPEAAGASFAAAADGAAPPEITVAAEPRSGVTITHRLMLWVGGELGPADGSGWNDAAPRAQLAPGAERWARGILGPAGSWTVAPAGGTGADGMPLDSLGLCALDVVAESVVLPGGCALDARCTADPALMLMARSAAGVLAQARPAVPADLDYPDPAADLSSGHVRTAPAPGPEELATLVDALAAQLNVVIGAISGVLAAAATAADGSSVPVPLPDAQLPTGLLAPLAAWGLPGSVLPQGTITSEQALTAAASASTMVRDAFTLISRGQPNAVTSTVSDGGMQEVGLDNWEAALRLVAQSSTGVDTLVKITRRLGGDAVVPTLALGLDRSTAVDVEQVDLQRWLVRTARVRPGMADYVDLCSFAEAAGRDAPGLTALQLPPTAGLAWLGGPLARADQPEDSNPETAAGINRLRRWKRPAQPHVHAVVSGLPAVDGGMAHHLLVLDEVAEVLPAPTVTTGLAINYNAPNAHAPQSILLAVHPNPEIAWTWRLLLETVREAMALTRIRGVDLDNLQPTGLGEYLPLIYLPDPPESALPLTPLDALTKERLRLLMTFKAYRNVRLAP